MPIHTLIDRLFLPMAFAIVLILGAAAYLVRRSIKIDDWPIRSDEDVRGQAVARSAVAEARRVLRRAALRAILLVSLLIGGVLLLNELVGGTFG